MHPLSPAVISSDVDSTKENHFPGPEAACTSYNPKLVKSRTKTAISEERRATQVRYNLNHRIGAMAETRDALWASFSRNTDNHGKFQDSI